MATIRKRRGPEGRSAWHVQIRLKGHPHLTRTFSTKAAAAAWARQVESEMERGFFRALAESERTTVAELIARYEVEIAPRKRSVVQIKSTVRHLARELGRYSVASLRPKDVADYRDRRLQVVQSATVRKELGALRAILSIARSEWGLHLPHGNPVEQINLPPMGRSRDRRLLPGEEARLLAACRAYGGPIESLVALALETAMRRGELARMRWEHLDRHSRVLRVPETKIGVPRRVPLSTRALAVLDALPRRIDGYVWGIRADSITQAFTRAVTAGRRDYEAECAPPVCGRKRVPGEPTHVRTPKNGRSRAPREPTSARTPKCGRSRVPTAPTDPRMLVGLRFHDLRHEATSRLFEKGLNPMEVATITGHKTLQMLKRYTHLRAEDLVDRLG